MADTDGVDVVDLGDDVVPEASYGAYGCEVLDGDLVEDVL